MSTDLNLRAIQTAVEHFNSPTTAERYYELYDPQCVFHGYPPDFPPNLPGIKGFYAMVRSAFPDLRLVVEEAIAEGNSVAGRYELHATHTGEFMGIPPTGRPVVITGQTFMHFRNGKVVERWQVGDMLGLLAQLGALPTGQKV